MSKPLEVTSDDFQELVLAAEKPVVVDFWAEWCGPCLMMAPVLDELSVELEDRVSFAKLNVDESPEIPMQYGVAGIPTLIVFKDGEEAGRVVGFGPKDALRDSLEEILSKQEHTPQPA